MNRIDRQVIESELIEEMLKLFDIAHVGMIDEDGFPYVVPVNFGFEMNDEKLYIYIHTTKRGHKVDLMKKNPRVCVEMSLFHDFPDCKYKGHYHDYRSLIAKGKIKFVDGHDDYETYKKGYDLLYTCNHREIIPLESRKVIPPMYIGVIECDMKDVTAKSEFPIRTKEDVPFLDVKKMPKDLTPFDVSDIIAKNKKFLNKK